MSDEIGQEEAAKRVAIKKQLQRLGVTGWDKDDPTGELQARLEAATKEREETSASCEFIEGGEAQ